MLLAILQYDVALRLVEVDETFQADVLADAQVHSSHMQVPPQYRKLILRRLHLMSSVMMLMMMMMKWIQMILICLAVLSVRMQTCNMHMTRMQKI